MADRWTRWGNNALSVCMGLCSLGAFALLPFLPHATAAMGATAGTFYVVVEVRNERRRKAKQARGEAAEGDQREAVHP